MKKTSFRLLLVFLVFGHSVGYGQEAQVYEIPFSLDKKLLIFKGTLNGREANFAFDTGAAEGIANSNHEKNKEVEKTGSSQRIIDGNQKIAYLQKSVTKQLTIGGFVFENVPASVTDIQYLFCMDLYLLGADVIRKLNWDIDFNKMTVKVSKNSFETTEQFIQIPVTYYYNTPRTKITLNEASFDNVLIDFGYDGVMTVPSTNKKFKTMLATKREAKLVRSKLSSSFAAAGLSEPSLTEMIKIDSCSINGYNYRQVPGDFLAKTDLKIGLGFFRSYSERVIINNSEKTIYLQLRTKSEFKKSFPVAVLLKDGMLKVSAVDLFENPSENIFEIGEEIKSINGKTASDFKTECEYITWFYGNQWDVLKIEKMNGTILEVKRAEKN